MKKNKIVSPLDAQAVRLHRPPRRARALPAAVAERAKHHLLDTLSAMVSGSATAGRGARRSAFGG